MDKKSLNNNLDQIQDETNRKLIEQDMQRDEVAELFAMCWEDPQFESEAMSIRPIRALQSEIIKRVENFVEKHEGGVMTIKSSRQTGKNEMAAEIQKRHLCFKQHSKNISSWIRTAPTYSPQIVNSKRRLDQILQLDGKNLIKHPLFFNKRLRKSEGYIYQVGNATVEFLSSGKQSNVVGATASECLDMDEAHKINKEKFDEDFMPFTASTNAATLLWGVAADEMDTLQWYINSNEENGRPELNLNYPCDVWAECVPTFAAHLEGRIKALGWDHPIIKTQYRLIPVSHEGTFLNAQQVRNLFNSEHQRLLRPTPGKVYEMLIDIAAGNEDFNPDKQFIGEAETTTDSSVVWIYEVQDEMCSNNIFPIIHMVSLKWWTGVPLPQQLEELKELISYWKVSKVTVDAIGVGRQIAEDLEQSFGPFLINKYVASSSTISDDCFDTLARLNYSAVKMFQNDGSPEYEQFEKQVNWTKYASNQGRMTLAKPKADKHIDMVKALTYVAQNKPSAAIHQIFSQETQY